MTAYVVISWFCCVMTSIILVITLSTQKFLLIKPSIIVIVFFHIMIQWSATVQSNMIERYLPEPFYFALLVQGFPLIGLYGSLLIGRKQAQKIWQRLINPDLVWDGYSRATFILTICMIIVTTVYLSFVPLSRTGLFTIFTDPLNSSQAREDSLKLLDSTSLRYSYSLMTSAIAPLLAGLLAMKIIWSMKQRKPLQFLLLMIYIMIIMAAVSLSGARSFAVTILLTVFVAIFLKAGLPVRIVYILPSIIVALLIPTILTILREGQNLTTGSFWQYLTEGIFGRIFNTPMVTGLWHTHYVQLHGFFGIRGISRLAVIFDVIPVNVPNLIGLTYTSSKIHTISANTSFVFSYYSYFGLYAFLLILPGLWLLDVALVIYKRLNDTLLLPCVASVSVTSISFISSDYTVVLLTHGFAVLLLLAWILGHQKNQQDTVQSRVLLLDSAEHTPTSRTTVALTHCKSAVHLVAESSVRKR